MKEAQAGQAVAVVLREDGTRQRFEVPREGLFRALYPVLDCTTIELVTLSQGWVMLCDEEGHLRGRGLNVNATRRAGRFIVGDAAVMLSADVL